MDTFDLSQVAMLYDKNRLRLGRWLAGAFAVALAIAVIWKGLGPTSSPYFLPGLSAGIAFDFWLWWFALYFFSPPPISVRVSPEVIQFNFKTGGARSFRTRDRGFRMKLAETLPPADTSRHGIIPDPPYFAVSRFNWLPLTPEAYRAIVAQMEAAKLALSVKLLPNPPAGGWRVLSYARERS